MTKPRFQGYVSSPGAKKEVLEGDIHECRLVAVFDTEEEAAQAVAEHNALAAIAGSAASLSQHWLDTQARAFNVNLTAAERDALNAELADIAARRDAAAEEEIDAHRQQAAKRVADAAARAAEDILMLSPQAARDIEGR